ncbi:hypothetical protein E2C01_082688 [Portunus trituberculatus]|uniref:Uncharacterized protein n=1 Tax=Portunus trituberculatus TaxID=210409 RepID=A0A5B7IV81_PORTR|nr:hypothetical protein [Portunus trituberculatus]
MLSGFELYKGSRRKSAGSQYWPNSQSWDTPFKHSFYILSASRWVDPDSITANKEWKHRLRTFTNFAKAVQKTSPNVDNLIT